MDVAAEQIKNLISLRCFVKEAKRERGENPLQPPLLYAGMKSYNTTGKTGRIGE